MISSPASGTEDIRSVRLTNGVQVLSEAIPGAYSVAVGIWVRQGGAHDPEALMGVSHFLEHMVFKGTDRRSAKEIALALESVGGSLNAYTSREHTCYEARVLAQHLPLAVDLLTDLVCNPVFNPDDIEREKDVVLEEIAAVEDAPDDLVFDLHGRQMWNDHPYGRPILGSRETVTRTSRADLQGYHAKGCVGANIVLVAVGAVEHHTFLALAEQLLGDVQAGSRTATLPKPANPMPSARWVERDSAQVHLVTAWFSERPSQQERIAMGLLSEALGGGMSSKLFTRIREELALAYAVYAFRAVYSQAAVLGAYVGTRPGSAQATLDALRTLYSEVAQTGLSANELTTIKEQVKGQMMLALESPVARLQRLANSALMDEPFTPLAQLPGMIDAVSHDDVARLADAMLEPSRQCVLCLGPQELIFGEAPR